MFLKINTAALFLLHSNLCWQQTLLYPCDLTYFQHDVKYTHALFVSEGRAQPRKGASWALFYDSSVVVHEL